MHKVKTKLPITGAVETVSNEWDISRLPGGLPASDTIQALSKTDAAWKLPRRLPISGTIELTGRCNLNCKMCYVHVDRERIRALGYQERSGAEWIAMARQMAEAGTFRLLLTGGEPMLRSDFCEIYEAIGRLGFHITLYTNATLVTPAILETLRRHPPHVLGVTIYGVSSETYEKVCGDPAGYGRMLSGLEQLCTLPSQMELRTTIIKDNVQEAAEIERFIKGIGDRVTCKVNQTVFQSGRDSIADPAKCRLSPKEQVAFLCQRYCNLADVYVQDVKQGTKSGNRKKGALENPLKQRTQPHMPEAELPYGCPAGYQEYTITWDGRMLPCTLLGGVFTEPFAEGFGQAWDRLASVMPVISVPVQCQTCRVRQFCGVCPAGRYCETGDVNGVPAYFCQLAEAYQTML